MEVSDKSAKPHLYIYCDCSSSGYGCCRFGASSFVISTEKIANGDLVYCGMLVQSMGTYLTYRGYCNECCSGCTLFDEFRTVSRLNDGYPSDMKPKEYLSNSFKKKCVVAQDATLSYDAAYAMYLETLIPNQYDESGEDGNSTNSNSDKYEIVD
jgi:hypothetical protein